MKKNGLKKGLSMAMTAAMAMSVMVMPVSAAETQSDHLGVAYTETASYTLNIPQNVVNLSESGEVRVDIGVSDINVGTKQSVQIKVAAENGGLSEDGKVTLTDKNDAKNQATSVVSLTTNGDPITTDTVVGRFENTSTEPVNNTGTLHFAALESTTQGLTSVPAGSYSGTLTFTADIIDESQAEQ